LPALAGDADGPPAPAPAQRLEDLGVELVGIRLSGADFLIDVRYRVKDVAKAQALMERKVHPVLVNEATGDRFYVPQAGRIEIDGIPLAQIGDAQFRADVGLVPQEPFLLAASARENIDMGRGLADDAIVAAARAAHAHDFIERLERGYDTPLGEGGARLSAGQKQLLAVARALAGQPRILFLDEATSRIDSETEREVQAAVATLAARTTVIAIAHRLSTIRDADTIVVLNHGRIAEQGTHDELMAIAGGLYQRLYLLQQIGE
jgi:ATP-binding cassette subfamily B protein/ATP-binding cassette subfamily C protein/ATP-binding cassette subfamily B multidrug efflux pump